MRGRKIIAFFLDRMSIMQPLSIEGETSAIDIMSRLRYLSPGKYFTRKLNKYQEKMMKVQSKTKISMFHTQVAFLKNSEHPASFSSFSTWKDYYILSSTLFFSGLLSLILLYLGSFSPSVENFDAFGFMCTSAGRALFTPSAF